MRPFHLAVPVPDLAKARYFYTEILGCTEGRAQENWVDINFFGHQLVFHEHPNQKLQHFENSVDAHHVPVPHFGVILEWNDWHSLAERLKNHDIKFIVDPHIRFQGKPGEQATLFFQDPNELSLEFKSFRNDEMIFEK